MTTILPDIYCHIVNFADLPTLVNLISVDKHFHNLASTKPIIEQWQCMTKWKNNQTHRELPTINTIFIQSCCFGFIEYAKYLVSVHQINIHVFKDSPFRISCSNGRLAIAQWLIALGESNDYTKIDITAVCNSAFVNSCINGHIDVVKWLIKLGESGNYKRIDIYAQNNHAFIYSCGRNHIDIVRYLIELEESGYSNGCSDVQSNGYSNGYPGYWFANALITSCEFGHTELAKMLVAYGESKRYINARIINTAFEYSCSNGYIETAMWLVQLAETAGYTRINIHNDNEVALRMSFQNGYFKIAKWLIKLGMCCGYGNFDTTVIKPLNSADKINKWITRISTNHPSIH